MQLFYSLIGINKLVFQFIKSCDNSQQYLQTEEIFTNKLTTFHRDIEDTYYNQILYPKLQNIWHMEKETFVACILCILSIINSDHIK
jgi:hypothetical protein